MDYSSFLFTLSAFAQISATIFAILLGFSIFLLAQKQSLHKIAFILLLSGIFGSIISCAVSIHALANASEDSYSESAVGIAEFFLFVSLVSVALLAIFAIQEMMRK